MRYKIIGGQFPAALCFMNPGEQITCQKGAMIWMDPGIEMQTSGGGLGKMFGRALTGEAMFVNNYIARKPGEIAFSSSLPGEIIPIELNGGAIIAQKGAFLASDPTVQMEVFLQKKLGAGFFGGEGFLMQKIYGKGTVLIEVDGSSYSYDLAPGQQKIIDTGYLLYMDATCQMSIEGVGGVKNALLGGEGFFNTVVTGPGHIVLQTMPVNKLAGALASLMPSRG